MRAVVALHREAAEPVLRVDDHGVRTGGGLDMDHVKLTWSTYLWAPFAIFPNVAANFVSGTTLLLLRQAGAAAGVLRSRPVNCAALVGRLLAPFAEAEADMMC